MKSFYDLDLLEDQVFGAETEEDWGAKTEYPPWDLVKEWEAPKELEGGRPVMLALTVDQQTQVECRVIGVFLEGDKEYIALELPEGEVQLMELKPGEDDGIDLVSIQKEEEQERVIQRFMELFGSDGGMTKANPPPTDPEGEFGSGDLSEQAAAIEQHGAIEQDMATEQRWESEKNHDRDQNREKD